jgi:hypothetical protein
MSPPKHHPNEVPMLPALESRMKPGPVKDERRIPSSVAESVIDAVKLYVEVCALAVKVREVGKHTNLLVDVEGRQHVPAVKTCPMARVAFRDLVKIPTPYRTPLLRLCYRAAREYQTNQKRYQPEFHDVSSELEILCRKPLCAWLMNFTMRSDLIYLAKQLRSIRGTIAYALDMSSASNSL